MPRPADSGTHRRHLPRLPAGYYRGLAFVLWTLTTERRASGWLTPEFHHRWQHLLLHACCRYDLVCPAYILIPDHLHLLWLGLDEKESDQRLAMEFLRRQSRPFMLPAVWQHQAHDRVLRAADQEHGAFQHAAQYILANPVRKDLAATPSAYPFLGCCVPGYPDLSVTTDDYWSLFWRIYNRLIERATRSRS